MHAYLLSWLGSCPACLCMCDACILTFMAWLVPRQCMHVLACVLTLMGMHTYSCGLARASPMYACACMHTDAYCLARTSPIMHVLCMHTYYCGLARASLLFAHTMHGRFFYHRPLGPLASTLSLDSGLLIVVCVSSIGAIRSLFCSSCSTLSLRDGCNCA